MYLEKSKGNNILNLEYSDLNENGRNCVNQGEDLSLMFHFNIPTDTVHKHPIFTFVHNSVATVLKSRYDNYEIDLILNIQR